MSVEKFNSLLPTFEKVYNEEKIKEVKKNKNRQRDIGGGRVFKKIVAFVEKFKGIGKIFD